MDLLNEKKVHYTAEACANCGRALMSASTGVCSDRVNLCPTCLEDRLSSHEDLRADVRRQFNLTRSPDLRSCFLRLLSSRGIDLEPGGWKTGMALGLELKSAGFAIHESRQIMIHARMNCKLEDRILDRLLSDIYRRKYQRPLTCDQVRSLDVVCDRCPNQYETQRRDQKTEIWQSQWLPEIDKIDEDGLRSI